MSKFKVGDHVVIIGSPGFYSYTDVGSRGKIIRKGRYYDDGWCEWHVRFYLISNLTHKDKKITPISFDIKEDRMKRIEPEPEPKKQTVKERAYSEDEWAKTVGE